MSKRQNNLIDVWSKARGKRRNTSEGVESLVDLTSDEPRDDTLAIYIASLTQT